MHLCLVSDDDEDLDGSMALAAAFQSSTHHEGMSGNPRDINDSLTRGRISAPSTGVSASPRVLANHREDVSTSSTPGVTGSGLGQATVVNNTLSINIDDLAKVLQSAKTDPGEIGRHVALQIERSGSSKRKQAGEDDEPDEESPRLVQQTFEICDNGHDVLSWPVRLALSPINRDPADIWTKDTYPRVKHPILGGTMYMEHLMPGEINHATLKLRHDRGYLLTVNQFIRRNASIFQRSSKKVQVSNTDGKGMILHTNKHWEPCRGVFEVVEGFLNYVASEHCIRPHSHEALAILRVLHELRWLANVTKKGVSQGRQLEELIQHLWHLNSVRGVQQKSPLSYAECKRHALEHLGPSLQRKIGQDEQGSPIFVLFLLLFLCF